MDKYTATEQAFKHGYEKGYEAGKPKWIPVSERLPEQYETVIGWDGLFMGEVEHGDYGFVWLDDDGCNSLANITHWMPLPEPPKED